MKLSKALIEFQGRAKESGEHYAEAAKLDFSLALEHRRRCTNLSYADIAAKICASAPYVSKVFRGDANLTIETMVKLALATEGKIEIRIVDRDHMTEPWNIPATPLKLAINNSPTIYFERSANSKAFDLQSAAVA